MKGVIGYDKEVIGDGAYESRKNFNFLDERGIEPIIKVRRNAVKRLRECPARRRDLTIGEKTQTGGGGSTA